MLGLLGLLGLLSCLVSELLSFCSGATLQPSNPATLPALRLLKGRQEAPMSRVEPIERPAKREAQESRRRPDNDAGRKPSQAEGDESEIDEALRNQDRRR